MIFPFEDEMEDLRQAVREAAQRYGKGSPEYRRAQEELLVLLRRQREAWSRGEPA